VSKFAAGGRKNGVRLPAASTRHSSTRSSSLPPPPTRKLAHGCETTNGAEVAVLEVEVERAAVRVLRPLALVARRQRGGCGRSAPLEEDERALLVADD